MLIAAATRSFLIGIFNTFRPLKIYFRYRISRLTGLVGYACFQESHRTGNLPWMPPLAAVLFG